MLQHNLTLQLEIRYTELGRISDIDEAIEIRSRRPKDGFGSGGEETRRWLGLGSLYRARFRRSKAVSGVDEGIKCLRLWFKIMPGAFPFSIRLSVQDDFAHPLALRFQLALAKKVDDIHEAISILRQGLSMSPENSTLHTTLRQSLSHRLSLRYKSIESPEDIEESIRIARELVDQAPQDSFARARYLNDLAARIATKGMLNRLE
jgi:hypothetical protein